MSGSPSARGFIHIDIINIMERKKDKTRWVTNRTVHVTSVNVFFLNIHKNVLENACQVRARNSTINTVVKPEQTNMF